VARATRHSLKWVDKHQGRDGSDVSYVPFHPVAGRCRHMNVPAAKPTPLYECLNSKTSNSEFANTDLPRHGRTSHRTHRQDGSDLAPFAGDADPRRPIKPQRCLVKRLFNRNAAHDNDLFYRTTTMICSPEPKKRWSRRSSRPLRKKPPHAVRGLFIDWWGSLTVVALRLPTS